MSEFLVYRASAGTGKTFTLVLKYLECTLRNPDEYRKILAVTFTNKAADEMKGRILRELHQLARNPDASPYAPLLEKTLKMPREALSKRAAEVLRQMLHDYSRISVGTIDRFFQQILRAFAREEGISGSYQVELDSEMVLDEVVARLIRESAQDENIRRLLVDWILHRMKSGKSWHGLEKELIRMGREILRENILDLAVSNQNGFLDPEQTSHLYRVCSAIMRSYEDDINNLADLAERAIARAGVTVEDFSYGPSGPAGFLVKRDPEKFSNTKRALDSLDDSDKWVARKAPVELRSRIVDLAFPDLNQLMHNLFALHETNLRNYRTAQLILKNLHAFSLARYLVTFLVDYGRKNDTLLMNLTQPIIRNIIRENPTPFIFEKTGTLFRHYLIDEFQDTSSMQWTNFRPLLDNCLSEGGLGMVVGDVKQSIYRWRNSNWRLLQEVAASDLARYGTGGAPLRENQRSREAIIQFNNRLFEAVPDVVAGFYGDALDGANEPAALSPQVIRDAYRDSAQERGTHSGSGGRVEIVFRKKEKGERKEDFIDWLSRELPLVVDDLLINRGYRQEDILFLVRKNREGEQVSKMLTDYQTREDGTPVEGWAVVSADIFRIGSNAAVRKILLALHVLADKGNTFHSRLLSWELSEHPPDGSGIDPDAIHPRVAALVHQADDLAALDLTGTIDRLVALLELGVNEADQPFILQFRDLAGSFRKTGGGHLSGYLEWWDRTGHKQMLVSESRPDAMKIMTIHKAKGLSSPVVILPFCDWELDHNQLKAPYLWVSTQQPPFDAAPVMPVIYTDKMKETWFREFYLQEWIDTHLDNLNLLYVSFTRPKDVLIAFCPLADKSRTVATALHEVLHRELDERSRYLSGNQEQRKVGGAAQEEPGLVDSGMIRLGRGTFPVVPAREAVIEARLTGELVHRLLEKMVTVDDLAHSLLEAAQDESFADLDLAAARHQLERIFKMPEVVRWFDGSGRVLAERSILVPGTPERRPDRIVIRDRAAEVIDYKTGKPEPEHKRQVLEYMDLVGRLGFEPVTGYILYIDQQKVVAVVRGQEGLFPHSLEDPAD